jgi:hypothetical protein
VDRFPATQPVSASAEILSASTCAIWIRPDRERKEEQALDRLKAELARPFAAHESARKPLTAPGRARPGEQPLDPQEIESEAKLRETAPSRPAGLTH